MSDVVAARIKDVAAEPPQDHAALFLLLADAIHFHVDRHDPDAELEARARAAAAELGEKKEVSIEHVLAIVDSEEELPGTPPPQFAHIATELRATVRVTKASIRKRLLARFGGGEVQQ